MAHEQTTAAIVVVARAKRRSRIMNRQGRLFHYSKPTGLESLAALTLALKSHLRVRLWAPDVRNSSDRVEACPTNFLTLHWLRGTSYQAVIFQQLVDSLL